MAAGAVAAVAVAALAAAVLVGRREDDVASARANVPAAQAPGSHPATPPITAGNDTPTAAKVLAAPQPTEPLPETTMGITASPAVASVAPPLRSATKTASVNTVRVVHQHRLGSCRGVLKASARGLEFAPEAPGGRDAFTLGYGEFLHDLDGDALVVKTSGRTFRFQAVEVNGKQDSRKLVALAGTLKGLR